MLFKKLLVGPIIMTALPAKGGYAFEGKIKLDDLLAIGGAISVASPPRLNQMDRVGGRLAGWDSQPGDSGPL